MPGDERLLQPHPRRAGKLIARHFHAHREHLREQFGGGVKLEAGVTRRAAVGAEFPGLPGRSKRAQGGADFLFAKAGAGDVRRRAQQCGGR